MQRRRFLPLLACGWQAARAQSSVQLDAHEGLVIERPRPGKPRAGQVVAAIQPHSDDIPIFAGGTLAKLIDEGASAFLIRVTNDDMAGPGNYAETVSANLRDHDAVAGVFGVKQVFDLNYNNHMMDNIARSELRQRFIFLFRLIRADILLTYDPWGLYEENPDHYVTSACAEAAAWMAGGAKDYPEHFAAGLKPHAIKEKYYFARFQHRVNRIVDIGPWVEKKIDANWENKAQGPAGENGARLRARLEREGVRLPLLGADNRTANREYIREFVLARDAEPYHYIGPEANRVEDYIRKNGVKR
jgi:LmbE family N-acetylglucosaminyl deacetylase